MNWKEEFNKKCGVINNGFQSAIEEQTTKAKDYMQEFDNQIPRERL